MSVINGNGDGEQTIESSVRDALLLRGVLNVAEELLAQPDVPFGLPLEQSERDEIGAVNRRVARQMDAAGGPNEIIRVELSSAEAMATLDALVSVESLMSSDGGRELLSAIGLIANPDSPTVRQELEEIGEWIEQLGFERESADNLRFQETETETTGPRRVGEIDHTGGLEHPGIEGIVDLFEQARVLIRQVRDDPPSVPFLDARFRDLEETVRDGEPTCERLVEVFAGVSILLSGMNAQALPPRERNPLLSTARGILSLAIDAAEHRDCISSTAADGLVGTWATAVDAVAPASEGRMLGTLEIAINETQEAFAPRSTESPRPRESAAGVPETSEMLDPTLPIVDAFAAVDHDMRNETILWPGMEQVNSIVFDIHDAIGDRDGLSCEQLIQSALELLLITVGGAQRGHWEDDPGGVGRQDRGRLMDTMSEVLDQLVREGCLTDRPNTQLQRLYRDLLQRVGGGNPSVDEALQFTDLLDRATGEL